MATDPLVPQENLRTIQFMPEEGDPILMEIEWDPVSEGPTQLLGKLRTAALAASFTERHMHFLEDAWDDVLVELDEESVDYALKHGFLDSGSTLVLGGDLAIKRGIRIVPSPGAPPGTNALHYWVEKWPSRRNTGPEATSWGPCECPSGCTRWARGRRGSARLCDYCAERAPGRWSSNCNCWCPGCWPVGRVQLPIPDKDTDHHAPCNRGKLPNGDAVHALATGASSASASHDTSPPLHGTPSCPCVDCGAPTLHCCDATSQPCLAALRVRKETWARHQLTPLCPRCDEEWGMCRFCRADHLMGTKANDPMALSGRVDILGQATLRGLDVTYAAILDLLLQQPLCVPYQ